MMSPINQYRVFSQSRPWSARILLVMLLIIALLVVIRISLPYAVKFGAAYWLESQGVEAHIGKVEISLLDGSFAINDVTGKNKNGDGFSLARFGIIWQWWPLTDHQLIIEQIELRALSLDAKLLANGDLNIAGLEIKPAEQSPTETTPPIAATVWDATLKNIVVTDVAVCLQQFADEAHAMLDYCGKLAALEWSGEAGFTPSRLSASDDTLPIYIQASLNLQGIALHNNQLEQRALLEIGALALKNIQVDTADDILIASLEVSDFSALQRAAITTTGDAQVLAFSRLNMQSIQLAQQNDLGIEAIELADFSSYLLIDKQGRTEVAQWLPAQQQAADEQKNSDVKTAAQIISEQPASVDAATETFNFELGKFIFVSSQHLMLIDDSLKETFTLDVHDIELRLTQLDTRAPEKPSHVSLALGIGRHGSFRLEADATPLSPRPSLKGEAEISGLDLRMIAPMTKQYVGHNVRSGQLDAKLKLGIDKGSIDSNIGLTLQQFMLEALSKQEAEKLDSEFGFPLNSSLSLLRDRDNTIRLDIPVSGDIDSPEFDPKDAIVKAGSKAITAAVLYYYTPFGLVLAGGSLFDLATALKFEPVMFAAAATELNAAQKASLDKLAALMTERPGIHLTLCGISNADDRDKLFPAPATATPASQQAAKAEQPIAEEQLAALKQLAESRSANIKNYLVHEKAVKASRLIECSPEYADDDIAGVKISI